METSISTLIGIGTILLSIDALFLFVTLFVPNTYVRSLIGKYGLLFGFLLSLLAALGTLYYSEVVGLLPCTLCWYQRAALYPIVLVFLYGLAKKDRRVFLGTIALSVIGLLVALYHVSLPLWTSPIFCDPATELCLIQYVKTFGFITIPVMSAVTFAWLLLLSIHGYRTHKKEGVSAPATSPSALA